MSHAADRCPVCGEAGRAFVRRKQVPVHQNQLFATADDARAAVVGDLRICHCGNCDFVWNAAFDPDLLSYHHAYDNTQTCSPRFSEHLDALVTQLVQERGVRDSRVVEVGCGNGEFLRRLVVGGAGNTGAGYDPSYRGPDEDLGGRVAFQRCFFGPEEATGEADVVVSRHVIEHVQEPIAILELMRSAIAGADDPRLFLETPDVAWILEGQVVWDFFYEHCSYFTPRSMAYAMGLAGLEVVAVDLVFADQYQWVQARPAAPGAGGAPASGAPGLAAAVEEFDRAERRLWERLGRQLEELAEDGPVAVWGAGAKGVTFANQLDPGGELLACVIDLNPAKQDGFLPRTAHPILSPQEAEDRGIATAVLLNPNYEHEIREMLAATGSRMSLVNADHVGVAN